MAERLIVALCYLVLRRDIGKGGAGSFSNSQWLDLKHRGSDKMRFQYCLDSNDDLTHLRAIQGQSGGTVN